MDKNSFNRIELVEKWLDILMLPELSIAEAQGLQNPPTWDAELKVYQDLVDVCQARYAETTFWPDFSKLELPYPIPTKKIKVPKRTFCIGL